MNFRKILFYISIISVIIFLGFKIKSNHIVNSVNTEVKSFEIDPEIKYQSIDNFGASDAWSMQFIGKWPEEKQEQIATWLFSTKNDDNGNPKGIGLSLWRFYIGAGSKEQGDNSQIDNPMRRNECFLLANGSYDWNKQAGQRRIMGKAKMKGVSQFLGFIYSAPVYWTKNGLATNLGGNESINLKEDKFDDYANFVADVIEGIERNEGVRFNYISPFNEPDGHWNWNGKGQEGTAATKYEVAKTARLISQEFSKRKLQTKILLPESSDIQCLYDMEEHVNHKRGYQIQSYFTPDSSETYVGDLYNVPNLTAGHSYWTTAPIKKMRATRLKLKQTLEDKKVRYWQSEVCVMGNDVEIGGGHKRDLTMNTALYFARVIHYDLVYAKCIGMALVAGRWYR